MFLEVVELGFFPEVKTNWSLVAMAYKNTYNNRNEKKIDILKVSEAEKLSQSS